VGDQENKDYVIATFYKFVDLSDYDFKAEIQDICAEHDIKGTILLADEGINATVAATTNDIASFYSALRGIDCFTDISFKESYSSFIPFKKMKVREKAEIVSLRNEEIKHLTPGISGTYLNSDEWDDLLKNEDVILIDSRNYYEVTMGSFEGAVNPETETFSELTEWLDKRLVDTPKEQKIAMFCTGGIRCEKSTAYVKKMGFSNVYHLHGGVLQYLKDRQGEMSMWNGLLFLFDDRVAVDANMKSIM